jgi:hypothetical protein
VKFTALALLAVLLAIPVLAAPVTHAPLPNQLTKAKKIFIVKGVGSTAHTVNGGYDLAFDSFYSEMKSWGRFELTETAEDADLIMQVTYGVNDGPTRVYSMTNASTNQTSVYSSGTFSAQLTLVVFDTHTKDALWSASVQPGVAMRKKNQEKEMGIAGQKLAENLIHRMPSDQQGTSK